MVISVPHSGTRTLLRLLGEPFLVPPGGDGKTGGYLHFGHHDNIICTLDPTTVDIPIRHPVFVLMAWQSRNKRVEDALTAIEKMMAFIDKYTKHTIKLHKIEDSGLVVGHHVSTNRSEKKARKALEGWLNDKRREFYKPYGYVLE